MVKVKEKKTEPKKKGPAPKMPKAIKGENKKIPLIGGIQILK